MSGIFEDDEDDEDDEEDEEDVVAVAAAGDEPHWLVVHHGLTQHRDISTGLTLTLCRRGLEN